MINKMELSNKASHIRKELGEDESSPIDIFTLAQTIKSLTLIFYPLGKNISGACFRNHSSSIIAINSNMSLGRQRFSLAHELYHLFFDKEQTSTICSSKIGGENENERKADQFASYFLMPSAALYESIQKCKEFTGKPLSVSDIIRLEQYFGVSHQAMLIRLLEEKELSSDDILSMQNGVISAAARLGFDVSLYKPSPEDKKARVLGYYICQAENLLHADIISVGKYEELLLDAFRDDIVFGSEAEGGDVLD
ncbi:MAG: ImmA/IrrE family metallo-endopeptidase [Lachnospiraceae bacterium]|nr:ImmA/IrrE family metallo-endopeptidase [Lachnospiraceae bacterium]